MKKVLIVSNHSFMLWRFRRDLIAALQAQGNEIAISVPFGDHIEDFRSMGCKMIDTPVDRRGINPVTDLKLLAVYRKLLKDERPDMVITYSIKPNVYAGYLCRCMGIPYCVNVQGLGTAFQKSGLAQLVTVMYRTALKRARVVFFENEGNARLFRELNITPASQQRVLHGAGINLAQYPPHPYLHKQPVHFLYLGRLMKEKGMDELFRAVQLLRRDGEDFVLDLVGFYEDAYKEQVEELAKQGVAVFHGFQQDPRPYYVQTDCVVLPSYHEGMSNVLLEGAATGRPLITSDIPGCREAVEPDVSGILCTARDSDSLYRAMKAFLSLSQIGRASCRERV